MLSLKHAMKMFCRCSTHATFLMRPHFSFNGKNGRHRMNNSPDIYCHKFLFPPPPIHCFCTPTSITFVVYKIHLTNTMHEHKQFTGVKTFIIFKVMVPVRFWFLKIKKFGSGFFSVCTGSNGSLKRVNFTKSSQT